MQEEVKATIEESRVVQEKYRSMYETCHRELIERQTQLDDLRSKVRLVLSQFVCTRIVLLCFLKLWQNLQLINNLIT